MPVQITDQPATPWRAPTEQLPIDTDHLQTTSWHVPKPTVAGDLQSTSTVTTSESPSSSSSSSPLSTANQPPTAWQLDEYDHHQAISPSTTPPTTPPVHQPASIRTLPRCGVVNFRKDGDSLRWAPRVTQNSSGVAARVHNFEDAFSLEEFSSRALPVVWHSKGGNPRLSDVSKSDIRHNSEQIPARWGKSAPASAANAQLLPPPKRSAQSMERRAQSLGQPTNNRGLVRNTSVKKAVMLATEARRPSFWSLIAHTNKYQRSKAKARLQKDAKKRTAKPPKPPVPHPNIDTSATDEVVPPTPWVAFTGRKTPKSFRGGKATRSKPESSNEKSLSLLRRLRSHLDRRRAKKAAFQGAGHHHSADTDRMEFSKTDSSSDSDDKPKCDDDRPKGMFGQGRHSESYSRRRVVSALSGTLPRRERREKSRVGSQDDQYVTFMTSLS